MTLDPAVLLRHRPPALLLTSVDDVARDRLRCTAAPSVQRTWRWPEMLEAGAQAAGLLGGLQRDGLDAGLVIAEYRDVHVHADRHDGPLRLFASLGRKALGFRRCRVEVRSAGDDALLLEAVVTLAPGGAAA
jgi:predicted hotdog family 3-hydroxylacyl-ACP dehydratase